MSSELRSTEAPAPPAAVAPPYVRARALAPTWHVAGLAVAAALALAPRILGAPSADPLPTRLAFYAVAGLVLFFVWQCGRVTIVVTKDSFSAGFRAWRSRVALADVTAVAFDPIRPLDLRAARRRGFAIPYVVGPGPAVLVRRRGGLDLLVSTDDAPGLFDALAAVGVPPEKLLREGETSARRNEPPPA